MLVLWMPHFVLPYSAQVPRITQSNSGQNPTLLVAGLKPGSWWSAILAERYPESCSLELTPSRSPHPHIFAKSAALSWPKPAHTWPCGARIWLSAALIGQTQLATWLLMRVAVVLFKVGIPCGALIAADYLLLVHTLDDVHCSCALFLKF